MWERREGPGKCGPQAGPFKSVSLSADAGKEGSASVNIFGREARFREMAPASDPKAEELLERLKNAKDRKEKVKLLKELVAKDLYMTDEMLEVAFARLVARLTEAE